MASADEKNFDDINVTPMVDLYLVLLLIFIQMPLVDQQHGTEPPGHQPDGQPHKHHDLGGNIG